MFHVEQQQLNTSWTELSRHTDGVDADYQLNEIYGRSVYYLRPMRIIDDRGTVYQTKALTTPITYLITPIVTLVENFPETTRRVLFGL